MPLGIGIMMKYSDVRNNGTRDPTNYYGQLQRCSADMPLNVLATINNRWIIGGGPDAQPSLEDEFLSPTFKNSAERFRKTIDGKVGIVFTRPGVLLNLKLLLALQPSASPYKATAIGAITLHANDFVESSDTTSLAHGTLPVIAEVAPTWELHNPRDPARLLFRSYYLYTLVQQDARMQALFDKAMRDVPLAGLSFQQYFTLLFGMYTNARTGATAAPFPTSILDAKDIAKKAHMTPEQFRAFATAKAIRFGDAERIPDRETFVKRVTDSRWTSSHLAFRNKPLLELHDGRFLALDLQFLFESASAGLSWTLQQQSRNTRTFLDTWGDLFEKTVQDALAHYYPDQAPVERTAPRQIDALLVDGNDVIAMEIKAGFIAENAKGSRDQIVIDAALRKKYVTDDKDRAVGIRQLAATATALVNGNAGVHFTGRVYPVLVGEDPMLQTIAMNTYLDDIFRNEVNNDRIAPLTVMLVDELEQLLPHFRAGDFTWQEFLQRRFADGRVTAEPVHTTFADLANEKRLRRRPETFLAAQREALIAMIKDTYKDLR